MMRCYSKVGESRESGNFYAFVMILSTHKCIHMYIFTTSNVNIRNLSTQAHENEFKYILPLVV